MKKITFLLAFIFTGFLFASAPIGASAQLGGTSPFIRYSSNIFVNSNMHLFFQKRWQISRLRAAGKHQVADALEGRRTNNGAPISTNAGAADAETVLRRSPLAATSFRPVAANLMPTSIAENLADASTKDRQAAYRVFLELLKNYDEQLTQQKETRLRNNVAGAAAFAVAASRYVLQGAELSEKQSEALLQDINALLASAEGFKKMTARERQQMYETFIISAGLAMMLSQQGQEQNDENLLEQGRDLAKTVIAQFFNVALEEVQFTETGVEF